MVKRGKAFYLQPTYLGPKMRNSYLTGGEFLPDARRNFQAA